MGVQGYKIGKQGYKIGKLFTLIQGYKIGVASSALWVHRLTCCVPPANVI